MPKWIKRNVSATTITDVVNALPAVGSYTIKNLDEVSAVLQQYVKSGKPMTLVGDYDADGICASSILYLSIKAMGGHINVRLPKRFSEGFGLSEKIVEEIDEGLLITVDNGIAAIDAVRKAKEKGLFVIITDHHLRAESGELPNADIIIDPNAVPDSAVFSDYCGAGIAFKLAVALLGVKHPLIPKLLSLAAIATIADVVSLTGENHVIARYGLARMVSAGGRTEGLKALLEACQLDESISAKDIAFKVAPMINAAGRLKDDGAMLSFNLLSGNYEGTAEEAAAVIHDINEIRKETKTREMSRILSEIAQKKRENSIPMCVYVPGLSEGLLGIYAAALVEEYHVPSLVFTDSDENGIYKGSGRSCGGVHLKNLLDKCADVLVKYGGHAEAAGVSVHADKFAELQMRLSASIGCVPAVNNDIIYYDLDVGSVDDIPSLIDELEEYGPYGAGNPEVIFRLKDFNLVDKYGSHYSLMSGGQSVRLFGENNVVAVGFNLAERYAELRQPRTVNLLGTISWNYYKGRKNAQIEIIDIKNVDDETSDAKRIETPISRYLSGLEKEAK